MVQLLNVRGLFDGYGYIESNRGQTHDDVWSAGEPKPEQTRPAQRACLKASVFGLAVCVIACAVVTSGGPAPDLPAAKLDQCLRKIAENCSLLLSLPLLACQFSGAVSVAALEDSGDDGSAQSPDDSDQCNKDSLHSSKFNIHSTS
ncbi:hypothetical protein ACWD25_25100 [Streptomyces sp. NPDC002920]